VDVFGGSGALIARQAPRALEIYNDLDSDVWNVFVMVKDAVACEQVLQWLKATSSDRQQYDVCRNILADTNKPSVRRAWAFVTCGTIGFSAHPAMTNGWTRSEKQRRDLLTLPDKLKWWHRRLQKVQLENRPWQQIVDLYDSPDTFFFCDPPYLSGVLRNSANQYYQHRMDANAHVELLERLRTIQGYALVCGYNHPLYTRLLFHWRRITFSARETMGGTAGKRQEVIWLNYEDDGSRIEGNRLRIARRYVKIMNDSEEEAIKYVERVKRLRKLLK